MKRIKKLICLAAALCLLLCVLAPAFAEETEAEPDPDARFEGKTWDEVTEAFIEEHNAKPNRVTIGYCNTVTGEENYYRGDEYMISASMYKVPLNMVYTDRITSGEMEWDSTVRGYVYEKALRDSIVYSQNQTSQDLAYALGNGNWRYFRETLVPYMCEDQENVDEMFFKNNFSTARQMIFCLKLLYENPDRFPRIIDLMKEAEPKNYFNYHAQPVEVAHKYGYLTDDTWGLILNDCGVIYTEDPFCLVVFTAGINRPYDFLADYCTLMIDYTEYHTRLRHQEELEQSREAAILSLTVTPEPTRAAVEDPAPGETGTEGGEEQPAEGLQIRPVLLTVLVIGLAAAALLAVLSAGRKKQLKVGWAALSVIFVSAALLLCVFAPGMKPAVSLPAETAGDPQESVRAFFDALESKDYERAYGYLYDYKTLGLENRPEEEAAQLLYDALCDSYGYTLYGDCVTDGLQAKQQVLLEILDLTALQEDLKAGTEARVNRMSEELPRSQLVDENDQYLPEITNGAYLDTLRELLSHPDKYKTTVGLELSLNYTQEGWRIVTDSQLLHALSGRTSYGRGGDRA